MAFVTGEALRVEGLTESIKALRALDKTLPRIVSKASRERVKADMLPPAVKNWAGQRIKPSVAGKAIKGSGTTTSAGLRLMAASHPYAMGVEFGSKQFPQFRAWRGNRFTVAPGSSTGYVVQDAIRDNLDGFSVKWQRDVGVAMDKAFRIAGV